MSQFSFAPATPKLALEPRPPVPYQIVRSAAIIYEQQLVQCDLFKAYQGAESSKIFLENIWQDEATVS
jgi:hypothetical protein